MKNKDLTGNKYGHLTVLKMHYKYKDNKHTFCECLCDCGNIFFIEATKLQTRTNPSCGCMTKYYRTLHQRTNETGRKFNRLEILKIDYSKHPSMAYCKCDCGKFKWIAKADVVSGHTKSCGCFQSQRTSEANLKDYSGVIALNGVEIISKSFKTDHGTWLYKCRCPLCGGTFNVLPSKVFENAVTSCGCKRSSGWERLISGLLDRYGAIYEQEKTFDDCRNKYKLRFDFVIYDNAGEINHIIEYDGAQHCHPIEFFGGEDAYRLRKENDNIKNEYCISHGYKLTRIDYTKTPEDIEEIIKHILNP